MPMFYNGETSRAEWVEPNVTATEAGTTGINIVLSAGYTISGRVFASENLTNLPAAASFVPQTSTTVRNGGKPGPDSTPARRA